jgi:RNA polymerase sigma-70 factor (ECF subfamily)
MANPKSIDEINELAEQAKDDSQKFGELYDIFFKKIYSFFYHRTNNNQATAEDLSSKTFEKVLKNIDRYNRNKAAFSTWIYTIAQNNLTDFYRKKSTRDKDSLENVAELNKTIDSNNHPDSLVKESRNKKILNRALSKLDSKDQLTLTLRYIQDLSYKEVASALGCSTNSAGVRIHRALNRLKKIAEKLNIEEKVDL